MENHGYLSPDDAETIEIREIINGGLTAEEAPKNFNGSINGSNDGSIGSSNYVIEVKPTRWQNRTAPGDVIEVRPKKSKQRISYETLLWAVFIFVTVFTVIERFIGHGDNLLRRDGHKMDRLLGPSGHVGHSFTNIVWAATGRLLITAQNLMFFTVMWCMPNTFAECAPTFLRVVGIMDIHKRAHRLCGTFLIGIPVVVHVLLVFLPPLTDNTKLIYHPPTSFNYSKQWMNLNWTRFYDPAKVDGLRMIDKEGVHMTLDEVYRLVLMVIIFGLWIPVSRSSYLNKRSYTLAITLHGIAGVWYAVDNIRKISHALAQVFNLPILVFWIIDRIISVAWYRRSIGEVVRHSTIGNLQYIDIRVKLNKSYERGVGDVYYLLEKQTSGCCSMERSHPFTSYSNHNKKDSSWDVGFIVAVMKHKHQWASAWTRRLCKSATTQEKSLLKCWGPYRSSVQDIYRQLELQERHNFVLLATGSGFGYLLDVLGVAAHKMRPNQKVTIDIHFSVRGEGFYQHYRHYVADLLETIRQTSKFDVTFTWYNTIANQGGGVVEHNRINQVNGRPDFDAILRSANDESTVYFVGRPALADTIAILCKKHRLEFVKDSVNAQRGKSDKALVVLYMKWTFYATAVSLLFCFVIGIYNRHS